MRDAVENDAKRRAKAVIKQRAKQGKARATQMKPEDVAGQNRRRGRRPVTGQKPSPTSRAPTPGDVSDSRGGGDRVSRHFVTLPSPRWLKLGIAGAENEVEPHCGIVIRRPHFGYDAYNGLVVRVGDLVLGWTAVSLCVPGEVGW